MNDIPQENTSTPSVAPLPSPQTQEDDPELDYIKVASFFLTFQVVFTLYKGIGMFMTLMVGTLFFDDPSANYGEFLRKEIITFPSLLILMTGASIYFYVHRKQHPRYFAISVLVFFLFLVIKQIQF